MMKMDVLCSSEMSVTVYQLTGPNIPEDVTLKTFKLLQQTLWLVGYVIN
jgi:hypothetical protein